jgi:fructose-1,6-bisphosphatase/inositol monophosphatase family enzyme
MQKDLEELRELLCQLENFIRDSVLAARDKCDSNKLASVAEITAADTIYHIDKIAEEAILAWMKEHWPPQFSVELIFEGANETNPITFPEKTPASRTLWKCILDPIDGTRNIMYDKRPAWVLAGIAPQNGPNTRLNHIMVAAMTEIPTSKQWRSDQISAIRERGFEGVIATAFDLRAKKTNSLKIGPSQAIDFKHGFASFARFFPEGKTLLAFLEEELWKELYGSGANSPLVFDDQYISTGGQMYELLMGHDRMLGDFRPLAFKKLGYSSSLACHPYDICTSLILEESGVILEGPMGEKLDYPLDTTTSVSWVAYANPILAKQVRPILHKLIKKHLL